MATPSFLRPNGRTPGCRKWKALYTSSILPKEYMKTCKKYGHEYEDSKRTCPVCHTEGSRRYRAANKEKVTETLRKWWQANREKQREYYEANKERKFENLRKWKKENKERVREIDRRYQRKRRTTNPLYKLSRNIRSLIKQSLMKQGYLNSARTASILGCDFETLQIHLIDSAISNYGYWSECEAYHIDHIIPLASAKDEAEIIRLNHYSNLQYLYPHHNLTKADKLDWVLDQKQPYKGYEYEQKEA